VSIKVSTAVELKNVFLADLQKELIKKTNLIYNGVVERSPVREGSFRANWKITQHRPSTAKFKRSGSVTSPTLAPAPRKLKLSSAGNVKVFISKLYGKSSMPKLPKIFISNNSPYAHLLENGSSKQAPNGIIAVTMANLNL
jgi:hypothetical protein